VNLYYYAWQITFFVSVFMGTVMVMKFVSRAPLRNTVNVVLLSFWIIILPPLLDYFVFNSSGIENAVYYSYLNKETILDFLFPFGAARHSTWGLIVQGWYVMAISVLYIWSRTKSAIRGVVGAAGIYLVALFLASDASAMCSAQNFIVDGGWV
jgi:hypothetical protein